MQSEVNALLLRVTLGNPAEVNAALDRMTRDARWRRLQPLDRPYGPFVTTLALAGRTGEARRVLAEWAASVPDDLRRTQGWKMATARGEILLAERDGILAWALQGCLEWQRLGLRPPATVLAATDEYFEAEDALGRWLDECCDTGASYIEVTGQLFASWKSWAEAGGEYVGSSKRFSDALINRGFQPQRDGGARLDRRRRLRSPLPTTGPMQF